MSRLLTFSHRQIGLIAGKGRGQWIRSCTTSSTPTPAVEAKNEKEPVPSSGTGDVLLAALKPTEIMTQLDKFIVGQADAKKAVAIALRNRWRRHQLPADLKNEVIPKNILMIGPTGCGKTEIARRIAKLSQAPFIKVEATKFTEVGFHGKDVDQIIRDLVDISISMTKKRLRDACKASVADIVEEKILDCLLGADGDESQKESYRTLLREGSLEDRTIDIEVPKSGGMDAKNGGGAIAFDMGSGANTEIAGAILKMTRGGGGGKKSAERKKMPISDARPILEDTEIDKVMEDYDVTKEAIASVEESGIVFLDEIDKLVNSGEYRGADASSEGVQRDLLPLIEGSSVSTKHGNVNTEFILFIASGAFHSSKPSDLLAELQGRLPIKVQLKGLTEEDLYRILTEPVANLVRQQIEMIKTEKVELVFTEDGVREMARVAHELNNTVENIGARRLHAIIEKVVEEISFTACEMEAGSKIIVDKDVVNGRLTDSVKVLDLRKYIL